MGQGSVKSNFQFYSYNVSKFNFYTDSSVKHSSEFHWNFNFKILRPVYSRKQKIYICGVAVRGSTNKERKEVVSQGALNLEAEIVGSFKVEEQVQSKELEERLVKIQGPSLLLPYLRAAITSYFANAGFGLVILPLINIHKLAENCLKDVEIRMSD